MESGNLKKDIKVVLLLTDDDKSIPNYARIEHLRATTGFIGTVVMVSPSMLKNQELLFAQSQKLAEASNITIEEANEQIISIIQQKPKQFIIKPHDFESIAEVKLIKEHFNTNTRRRYNRNNFKYNRKK